LRYAVFSDIHGNVQALRAVLERMDEREVDCRLCLGDIVGYGGNPNECVDAVRRSGARCIAGNHDHAVLGIAGIGQFNSRARAAAIWTADVLTEENRRFLSDLPLVLSAHDVLCVHASPREPEQWHYILTAHQAEEAFESFDETICLIGHSHRPLVVARDRGETCSLPFREDIRIRAGNRYVINGGSVGQPRDGNPDAAFLWLDTDRGWARIERVPYDIGGAQRAILEAGLPAPLAERLEHGR